MSNLFFSKSAQATHGVMAVIPKQTEFFIFRNYHPRKEIGPKSNLAKTSRACCNWWLQVSRALVPSCSTLSRQVRVVIHSTLVDGSFRRKTIPIGLRWQTGYGAYE
jgi:hypothetical protein